MEIKLTFESIIDSLTFRVYVDRNKLNLDVETDPSINSFLVEEALKQSGISYTMDEMYENIYDEDVEEDDVVFYRFSIDFPNKKLKKLAPEFYNNIEIDIPLINDSIHEKRQNDFEEVFTLKYGGYLGGYLHLLGYGKEMVLEIVNSPLSIAELNRIELPDPSDFKFDGSWEGLEELKEIVKFPEPQQESEINIKADGKYYHKGLGVLRLENNKLVGIEILVSKNPDTNEEKNIIKIVNPIIIGEK